MAVTVSIGREFWNHRQMFGRLAITRDENPNLKDKAGREGLLDNRAAKTLKLIVANILSRSARLYFGSASDIRKEVLPQVKASNLAERAKEDRAKLRQRQRRQFRAQLDENAGKVPAMVKELEAFVQSIAIEDDRDITANQAALERFKDRIADLRFPFVPQTLGSLEDKYKSYRESMSAAAALIEAAADEIERYM